MAEKLERLFSEEQQNVDYSLVNYTEYVLKQEVANFQVVNFYIFSWDELSFLMSVTFSVVSILLFKYLRILKIYWKIPTLR